MAVFCACAADDLNDERRHLGEFYVYVIAISLMGGVEMLISIL